MGVLGGRVRLPQRLPLLPVRSTPRWMGVRVVLESTARAVPDAEGVDLMHKLTCPKCGATVSVLHERDRVWHQLCPRRGPQSAAPEYKRDEPT